MLQLRFWLCHGHGPASSAPGGSAGAPSYVAASTFVSHVIRTATAGAPPDMTAPGDTPSTATTSATSTTTAQA